jgi:hypothetical protein
VTAFVDDIVVCGWAPPRSRTTAIPLDGWTVPGAPRRQRAGLERLDHRHPGSPIQFACATGSANRVSCTSLIRSAVPTATRTITALVGRKERTSRNGTSVSTPAFGDLAQGSQAGRLDVDACDTLRSPLVNGATIPQREALGNGE